MERNINLYLEYAQHAIRAKANELGRRGLPLLHPELHEIGSRAIDDLYKRGIKKKSRIFQHSFTNEQKEELASLHCCLKEILEEFIDKTILAVNKRRSRLEIKKAFAVATVESVMEEAGLTYSIECTGNGVRLYVRLIKNKMAVLYMSYRNVASQVKKVAEIVESLNSMYTIYGPNSRVTKTALPIQWKCSSAQGNI